MSVVKACRVIAKIRKAATATSPGQPAPLPEILVPSVMPEVDIVDMAWIRAVVPFSPAITRMPHSTTVSET